MLIVLSVVFYIVWKMFTAEDHCYYIATYVATHDACMDFEVIALPAFKTTPLWPEIVSGMKAMV